MMLDFPKEKYLKIQERKASVGVCRGALGEIYQGPSMSEKNEIVIVSTLIPKYSWAYFTPCKRGFSRLQDQESAAPARSKSFHALRLYCNNNNLIWPRGRWHFHSDLDVARGMASSTADIVAMLRCAASYFKRMLNTDEITNILAKIERSDSVFLDRLALFSSSSHKVIRQFNKMPPLYAIYMHEKETIETDGTKSMLVDFYQKNHHHYTQLYYQAEQALTQANLKAICQVATKSAALSQEVLPKQHFEQIVQAQYRFSADGVITAHTGSVIGLLYCQPPDIQLLERIALFYKELGSHCQYTEIGV